MNNISMLAFIAFCFPGCGHPTAQSLLALHSDLSSLYQMVSKKAVFIDEVVAKESLIQV